MGWRDQTVPQRYSELKGSEAKMWVEKKGRVVIRTDLGEEEEEDGEGGEDGDETAGEGAAVEVLVHLRVGVQVPQLAPELHRFGSHRRRDRRSSGSRGRDLRRRRGRREEWGGYLWNLSG